MTDTSPEDTALLRRVAQLLRGSVDDDRQSWLQGYQRGLRRAIHGERFGTADEHALWLSMADSPDGRRAEMGRGYRAGLARAPLDGGETPDSDRLRAWLTEHGRTQRGLARELGVDERTVRYWASGQQPVPRVVWLALERLASMSAPG